MTFVALGVIFLMALVAIAVVVSNLIVICQPNEVLVFSGMGGGERGYRLLHSGKAVRIPLFQKIDRMVEKPAVGEAPSNQSIIGRYVLPARTLELLHETKPGAGGEIQLTDALDALIAEMPVQANSMQGRTYDCGSRLGYLIANLKYGLNHAEIGPQLADWIRQQDL